MVGPHEVYDAHPQHPLALDHQQRVVDDALVAQEARVVLKGPHGGIVDLRLQYVGPSVLVDGEVGVEPGEGLLANGSCQPIDLRSLEVVHLERARHADEDVLHDHELVDLAADGGLVDAVDLGEVAEPAAVPLVLHVLQVRRRELLELHELLLVDDLHH